MNTRHPVLWFFVALFAIFLAFVFIAETAATQSEKSGNLNSTVNHLDGLTVVTFNVSPGKIKVYLPDDMAAGDTISGTVVTEPQGQTEQDRARNLAGMNGYLVQLHDPNKGLKIADLWRIDLSNPQGTENSFKVTLPNFIGQPPRGANDLGQSNWVIDVSLMNNAGSTVQTATVPFGPRRSSQNFVQIERMALPRENTVFVGMTNSQPQPSTGNPPGNFYAPNLGQQGRPVVIFGPFDGNSSNTMLNWSAPKINVQDFEKNTENVSGGFGLLAESPRKAVFEAPANVTGSIELHLNERDIETKSNYRNVGVQLSAPKTNLLKGESTTLKVEVSGLQGIKQPVPLTL